MLETDLSFQKKSLLDRFLGIVVEPSSTLGYVVKKPDLIMPLLIILLISLATIPAGEIIREQALQSLPANVDLATVPAYSPLGATIQSILGLSVLMLLKGVLFSVLGILFGSKFNFKASLAVVGYLNFPSLIATAIVGATVKLNGTINNISLGHFLTEEQLLSKLGIFLTNITPFSLWYLWLSVIALHHLWSISKKRALFITIIMWLLVVGSNMFVTSITTSLLTAG